MKKTFYLSSCVVNDLPLLSAFVDHHTVGRFDRNYATTTTIHVRLHITLQVPRWTTDDRIQAKNSTSGMWFYLELSHLMQTFDNALLRLADVPVCRGGYDRFAFVCLSAGLHKNVLVLYTLLNLVEGCNMGLGRTHLIQGADPFCLFVFIMNWTQYFSAHKLSGLHGLNPFYEYE